MTDTKKLREIEKNIRNIFAEFYREKGGPGSGRYPAGSGGGKDSTSSGTTSKIGVGERKATLTRYIEALNQGAEADTPLTAQSKREFAPLFQDNPTQALAQEMYDTLANAGMDPNETTELARTLESMHPGIKLDDWRNQSRKKK